MLNEALADAAQVELSARRYRRGDELGGGGDPGVLVHGCRQTVAAGRRRCDIPTAACGSPRCGRSWRSIRRRRIPAPAACRRRSPGSPTRPASGAPSSPCPRISPRPTWPASSPRTALEAEPTNRGRDAVDMARQAADLEMVLVDMNILVPDIRQVLYELRSEPPRPRSRSRSSRPTAGSQRPTDWPANTTARSRRRGPILRKFSPHRGPIENTAGRDPSRPTNAPRKPLRQ